MPGERPELCEGAACTGEPDRREGLGLQGELI
jgi:hypothetical protein